MLAQYTGLPIVPLNLSRKKVLPSWDGFLDSPSVWTLRRDDLRGLAGTPPWRIRACRVGELERRMNAITRD